MSVDLNKVINEPITEEQYDEDTTRKTLFFFKDKGIELEDLLKWQKEYPIIFPWNKQYNTLRLGFNRIGQFFPKFIMMVKKRRDAQWALKFAKQNNIEFSIKSGGHDSLNHSLSDGIIIDMSNRDYIKTRYDGTIKLGAGVKLGFLIEELNKQKLFISSGSCHNVGVSGLVQGGGIGFLRRKFGLTIDFLLEVSIILANGEIVKANKNINIDLFWALRGSGGGSFGIITDLIFKTEKIDKLVVFDLWVPFKYFEQILTIWPEWNFNANNNLTSYLQLYSPNNKEHKEAILIAGQFLGRKSELKVLLKVFEDYVSFSSIHYKNLLQLECECLISVPPFFYKYLNLLCDEYFNVETIRRLKKIMKLSPSNASIEIDGMGGKVAETGATETAFYWRNSKFWLLLRAASDSQADIPNMNKWVCSTYQYLLDEGVKEHSYCNFKNPDLDKEHYPYVYWGKNAKQLSKIKQKYDPDNVFHFAQSIPLKY